MNSEQWKLDGKCFECRRKEYCSKPCKVNKNRVKGIVLNSIDKRTGGVFSQVMMSSKY